MKKIMLLMAAALVSLSACSKSANEPVVKTQNQDDEVLTSLPLNIEGELEDVAIVDEEGRALDLKGSVTGSSWSKLSGVKFGESSTIEGIICIYDPNLPDSPGGRPTGNGIMRQVTFQVHGNKVGFRGDLPNVGIQKKRLPYLTMNVYLGGTLTTAGINSKGVGRGADVTYAASTTAIRTQDGMDLSKLNPIFYSTNMKVVDGKAGQSQDYYSTNHKFKLLGEFVSVRARLTKAGAKAQFTGFAVRGYGRAGITLKAPKSDNGNRPFWVATKESAKEQFGYYNKLEDEKTYRLEGDNSAPYDAQLNNPNQKEDVAYTLYLFTEVEKLGGIRLANGSATANIFINGSGANNSNYWGASTASPHPAKNANFGKFSNLVLRVK